MSRLNTDILLALSRSPGLEEFARQAGMDPEEVRRALRGDDGVPAGPPSRLVIHVDGASRGNPGLAAAGVAIDDERGSAVLHRGVFLGKATNNEAEYPGAGHRPRPRPVFGRRAGFGPLRLRTDGPPDQRPLPG